VTGKVVKNTGLESLKRQDIEHLAKQAIDLLPPKCRLIFNLSRSEEMSHAEIASHLGISKKAVEKQISKALKHLKHHLKPYLGVLLYFLFT
jgi:RNA polymerase sigma-70 factor (ECF subfamily)